MAWWWTPRGACGWLSGAATRCAGTPPAGELLAELPVPVSQPSCPAFGGPDLADLYLTTAWEDMTEVQRAAEPLAGHVLRTRYGGVAGQPPSTFSG